MNYRTLGKTGLKVSEISMGTWAFGKNIYGKVSEKQGIETIHEAINQGINLFDTAPQYGTDQQDGVAEIVLGKALKNKRTNYLISTKFGRNPCIKNGTSQFYKSRIINSVEESLKRLQTDYIDILFFHSPFSPNEINEDVWEGIEQVIKQGKVRFIGHSISMFSQTQNMARVWASEDRISIVQVVLNLMNRESQKLIEELSLSGIGVFARECLANGFLAGKFTENTVFEKESLNARYTKAELKERINQVDKFRFLTKANNLTMPEAALRWVLDQKGVSTVLSGAKNKLELQQAAKASTTFPFSAEALNQAIKVLKKDFEAA